MLSGFPSHCDMFKFLQNTCGRHPQKLYVKKQLLVTVRTKVLQHAFYLLEHPTSMQFDAQVRRLDILSAHKNSAKQIQPI